MPNPLTELMRSATAHALAHGALPPALSPLDTLPLAARAVDVEALHTLGVRVIPWTTNDPAMMRRLIDMGVDGLVTDHPDRLQSVLAETPAPAGFAVQGHRGARGLRPENTLPSFEAALDNMVDAIETDVGITRDLMPILLHEQFINPACCRRCDGKAYDFGDAIYLRELTLAEAQSSFLCDKLLPRFPGQCNDPALSPVACAFALEEGLPSPYSPVSVDQLFRFTTFYADFHRANEKGAKAARVRFNLEAKILPFADGGAAKPVANEDPTTNHTVDLQTFVSTLCNAITRARMESRCAILSFNFRALLLVTEQFPAIGTYYLIEDPRVLSSDLVPASLRQSAPMP